MRTVTLPRTQAGRLAVYDAISAAADEVGLPVPGVQFLEFARGFRVELHLPPGDRVGVDQWARALSLPVAHVHADDQRYVAELHAPGTDVWCGACWVVAACDLTPAGA
jgi:hypothetical protein